MDPRTRRARSPRPSPFCPPDREPAPVGPSRNRPHRGKAGGFVFRAGGTDFRSASATVNPGISSPRTSRRSRTWTGLKPRLRYAAALVGTGTRTSPCAGPGRGVEGARQAPGQLGAQPGLPVAFEGQQALRQLGPVCPGRHHGQQHGAVHVHQGRSLGLCPERPERQQAQLTGSTRRRVPSPPPRSRRSPLEWPGRAPQPPLRLSGRPASPAAARSSRGVAPPWPWPGQGQGPLPGPGWCGCPSSDPGPGAPPVVARRAAMWTTPWPEPSSRTRVTAAPPWSEGAPVSPGRGRRSAVVRGGAGQPGNEGSMGPLSCGDQPLPSRWKIPSADWP